MKHHLTVEQRQLARSLSAKGLSLREIGRQVGCSHEVVRAVVRRDSKRPLRSDPWQPRSGRLTLADREEISLGLRAGESFTAIATRPGKATSTVSREVMANGGRRDYRAWRAHQRKGTTSQAVQAVLRRLGGPGHRLAERVVVAAGDLPPVADGVPRRSDDAREPPHGRSRTGHLVFAIDVYPAHRQNKRPPQGSCIRDRPATTTATVKPGSSPVR